MATVTVVLPNDGDVAIVEPYNNAIDAILAQVNGNLDDNNIASMNGSKIVGGSLPPTAFNATANQGWVPLTSTFVYGSNGGNKEFTVTAANVDLTSTLSAGMKVKIPRSTTPPTTSMGFVAASSEYATNSSPAGFTFTGSYSYEGWVYLNSYPASGAVYYVIGRTDHTTGGSALRILPTGQVNSFYGGSSTFTSFVSYQSIPLKRWVHVAASVDAIDQTAILTINGSSVPFSQALAATTVTQISNLSVGAAGAGVSATFMDGYIAEARAWGINISLSSIQSNMGINCIGTESNLIACYTGNTWSDKTSNANTLTPVNSAVNTQASYPYNATEYGYISKISYSSPTTTILIKSNGVIPNMTLNSPSYAIADAPYGWPDIKTSLAGHRLLDIPVGAQYTTTSSSTTFPAVQGASFTVPANCSTVKVKGFATSFAVSATYAVVLYIYNGSPSNATNVGQLNQIATNTFLAFEVLVPVVPGSTFNLYLGWGVTGGTGTYGASVNNELQGFWVEAA